MGRAPCCDKNGLKKGPWTPEEDQKLIDYIQKNGYGNWRTLPKNAGLQRCGKSCRLRWTNYLRPDIKRGRFSFEEEETIIQLHSILGNKWSAIAARLPGRTDNEIKNYWNTHIRKRLLRMGIDPVTHSPRLDLLDLSTILNSSLYNNNNPSQVNFSRLLGIHQPLVNPELLRLATSLFPPQRQSQDHFLIQTNTNNPPHPIHPQMPALVQDIPSSCTGLNNTSGVTTISQSNNFDQFSSDITTFSTAQNCQITDCWQNNMNNDYAPVSSYGHYGNSEPSVVDPPSSDTTNSTTFQYSNNNSSSCNNNNFGFQSTVLSNISTPSSSPNELHSNFNSNITSEVDERESYCSNMLKFDIPDILDVNDFM